MGPGAMAPLFDSGGLPPHSETSLFSICAKTKSSFDKRK